MDHGLSLVSQREVNLKRWNPKYFPRSPYYYHNIIARKLGILDTRGEEYLTDYLIEPLNKMWWAIRRNVAPYNRLKIDSLSKEYADADEYLLHASFQILRNFIEQEEPFDFIDYSTNELDRWVESELKTLYHWWVKDRPNRENPWEREFDGREYVEDEAEHDPFGFGTMAIPNRSGRRMGRLTPEYKAHLDECQRVEDDQRREDDQMLHRLINIRSHLWT